MRGDAPVLEAIEACYAETDMERWPRVAATALRRLVPCEVVVFNDVDPETGRIIAISDPDGWVPAWAYPVWAAYGTQNPLLRAALAGDVTPYTWDDVIDRAELERLELWQQMYRPFGIADQLAVTITAPRPQVVAFTLNLAEGRFTREDRELARALQPHLTRAYDAARAGAGMRRDEARLTAALETAGVALLVLDHEGGVLEATTPARALLADAGVHVEPGRRAPDAILDVLAFGEPLRTADGRRIALELAPRDDETVIVLRGTVAPPAAARAGLTARELEVLDLARGGLAPKGIAFHLGLSQRTVHKHLQNAYAKLGVPNLVAALALLRGEG